VKNDSPIQSLADLKDKRVATTSGSIYDRWMKNCFPGTSVTAADSFTNAPLAFNQRRADALMSDDTVLVGVAAADRSAKLTNDLSL
jgi:ABC-type amino acid transport substrate-binding protein